MDQPLKAYQIGANDIVAAYSPEGALAVLIELAGDIDPLTSPSRTPSWIVRWSMRMTVPAPLSAKCWRSSVRQPIFLVGNNLRPDIVAARGLRLCRQCLLKITDPTAHFGRNIATAWIGCPNPILQRIGAQHAAESPLRQVVRHVIAWQLHQAEPL